MARVTDYERLQAASGMVPIERPLPTNDNCDATLGNQLVARFIIRAPRTGTLANEPTGPDEPAFGGGGDIIVPF